MILLVVDDDDLVRSVLADTIRDQGWDVMEASTAEEALKLRSTGDIPLVLVTDINLGAGMDGVSFASLARLLWADIGVVYISGRPLDPSCVREERHERFLLKPFGPQELSAAISAVLHSS